MYEGSKPTKPTIREILRDPELFGYSFFGWEPHEKQKQVLRCKTKDKTVVSGRRSGKSEMAAIELLRGAISLEFPRQAAISPTYRQSRVIFDRLHKFAYLSSHAMNEVLSVTSFPSAAIRFKNGAAIDFLSSQDFNNLRGENYDRLFLDEAGDIPDQAMNAIRPMLFDTGGPLWKIGTPRGNNHFYQSYVEGLKTGSSFSFTSLDNPHVNRQEIEKEIALYGADSIYVKQEIFAQFVDDTGKVFRWQDIEKSFLEGHLSACGIAGRRYVIGCDIAKARDFTFIAVLDATDEQYSLSWMERFNLTNTSLPDGMGLLTDYLPSRLEVLHKSFNSARILVDSTGIGDVALEAIRKKVPADGLKFTNSEKFGLVMELNGRLQGGKIRIPACEETLVLRHELGFFEYGQSGENVKMNAKAGFTDDGIMALALAIRCAKRVPLLFAASSAQPNVPKTWEDYSRYFRKIA